MTDYVIDSCTGTAWQTFASHTVNLGGPATQHPNESGAMYVVSNRAVCRSAPSLYYYGAIPASANYKVDADIVVLTSDGSSGVCGRVSTSAHTYYTAYIEQTTNKVVLAKRVAGTITSLGVSTGSFSSDTYKLTLDMNGSTIRALVDGVQVLSVTDSAITAVGRGGIRAPVVSDTSIGKHIDNVKVYDATVSAVTKSYGMIIGL